MKKTIVILSIYSVFISLNLQAIDTALDIIMINDQRYEVKIPIRYKDAKSAKEFKKDPFYIDFMKRVLDDDAILKGKSANPPYEIDRCIGENLNRERSLQLSAVECFSREVDSEYKGYGTWSDKNGNEVLVLPKSPARFLESYLQGINLPKKVDINKNIKMPTCFESPNHPDLNCFKFHCDAPEDIERYSQYSSRPDWCGKSFCEKGKAFLKEDVNYLSSYFRLSVKKNEIDTSAFGMSIGELIKLEGSPDSYEPKKLCFPCPPGSKIDEYGSKCIDKKNGCNAILEEYSSIKKKCINKYKNYEKSCSQFYNDSIRFIEYTRSDITKSDFVLQYSSYYAIQIDSQDLSKELRARFSSEFVVRASQAIARYEHRAKNCKDSEELVDDFINDLLDMSSKYQCEKNSDGQCRHASCIKCNGLHSIFSDNFKKIDMPSIRNACGSHILNRLLYSLPRDKYHNLLDDLYNCGSKPIQCPEFSITEQEVIGYAIRAGFDCAREAVIQRKSSGSR